MCEPLLLANPYMNTLRHPCSRASTVAKEPARSHEYFAAVVLRGLAARFALLFSGLGVTHSAPSFLDGLATWFDMRTNSVEGYPRIARGAPWAGSITGGEACGYVCSEKEGFTHSPFWRARCFWGTYELKLHAVDT